MAKSFDGRREKTVLEELVARHFGLRDLSDLKSEVYNPVLSKIEVAELALLCSQAYEQNDPAAQAIFSWAEQELCLLVITVLRRLELMTTPCDIVFSGSVLQVPHIYQSLEKLLKEKHPQLTIVVPETPPVHGAVKLARTT